MTLTCPARSRSTRSSSEHVSAEIDCSIGSGDTEIELCTISVRSCAGHSAVEPRTVDPPVITQPIRTESAPQTRTEKRTLLLSHVVFGPSGVCELNCTLARCISLSVSVEARNRYFDPVV